MVGGIIRYFVGNLYSNMYDINIPNFIYSNMLQYLNLSMMNLKMYVCWLLEKLQLSFTMAEPI